MSGKTPRARVNAEAVYGARSRDELEAIYDRWAGEYDEDATGYFGYLGPELALERFERLVPKDARILDAGAGTGRLGKLLFDAGYRDLTGFDLSRGMLAQAESLGVYRALHHMALGETLGYADDAFDATACIGTLTTGHAPAEGIDELLRVTRGGGLIVLSLNLDTYTADGIKDRIDRLLADRQWVLVEASGSLRIMPRGAPDMNHEIRVFRVGAE
ncbi:MAG: class I SAM-dependent methyltransferase [Gammaproteobacteria bacterium]|nr:class I SAM-dependent methyltransferase [Gammaproteobacteria bacterium]